MKKIFLLLIIVFFVSYSLFSFSLFSNEDSELTLHPGDRATGRVEVALEGHSSWRDPQKDNHYARIRFERLRLRDSRRLPSFLRWVHHSRQIVRIKSYHDGEMVFSIRVPKNARYGQYFCTLVVEKLGFRGTRGSSRNSGSSSRYYNNILRGLATQENSHSRGCREESNLVIQDKVRIALIVNVAPRTNFDHKIRARVKSRYLDVDLKVFPRTGYRHNSRSGKKHNNGDYNYDEEKYKHYRHEKYRKFEYKKENGEKYYHYKKSDDYYYKKSSYNSEKKNSTGWKVAGAALVVGGILIVAGG